MYQSPGPFIDDYTFLESDITLPENNQDNTWPISFTLPVTFDHEGKQFPLPPSYMDKAYINYSITATAKRGILHKNTVYVDRPPPLTNIYLSTSHSLTQAFRYIPRTRPHAPSISNLTEKGVPDKGEFRFTSIQHISLSQY